MTRKLPTILLALFLLLTAYVTLAVVWGWPGQVWLMQLLTFVQWAFALTHAAFVLRWRQALLFAGLSFAVSFLFEAVGVATGMVYGPYHYTTLLGPLLLGVPFIIPLAWFMMIYPSFIVAWVLLSAEARQEQNSLWMLALLSAVLMTAWDLALDPIMAAAGHWVWDVPGPYFGVPIHNFVGWLLTTLVIYLLFLGLSRRRLLPSLRRADKRTLIQPIIVYAATGAILILRPVLDSDPSELAQAMGLIAAFTMGTPVLIALWRLRLGRANEG